MTSPWRFLWLALALIAPVRAFAEAAPYDLVGPKLEVKVTRAAVTLPISQAPNLAAGDRVWIRADLPAVQSVHYLLVAAFLRGATDPPPQSWFYRSETWTAKGRDGLTITVPAGAQQVLVFLAPQTGGDFKTLVDAVRGRPGAFVRASQDLNQAYLDRSRLDAYLASIRKIDQADQDRLKTVVPLLARSLTIKLNADCLEKSPELQAACLMQGGDALVLSDGHSTSIVQALTSGDAGNLVEQLSVTPQAGFGSYSPYVGAVMDIARILDSFHTAQYQYIPALATSQGDQLSLVLNAPPSFHNPLSVLVAALPAVEPPQAPPLTPVDPGAVYCVGDPRLVLPIQGAPLAYSTAYAHDMVLRLKGRDGAPIDVPAAADAAQGGFVADTSGVKPGSLGPPADGVLHGDWGFEAFDGPAFHLQYAGPEHWQLAAEDQDSLIVGRDATVHLDAPRAACVESVSLRQASGPPLPVEWKAAQPNELTVTLPLAQAQPGPLTLLVKQFGGQAADPVVLQAFVRAGRLDSFSFHIGDPSGVLKGARLDEVTGLNIHGVAFRPGPLATSGGADELTLVAVDPAAAAALRAGDTAVAKVALKDGRSMELKVAIGAPRPSVSLISKSVQPDSQVAHGLVQLSDPTETPFGAVLTFSVRAERPAVLSEQDSLEVAGADGAPLATLTFASGLMLEDSRVAVASLDTGKALGASAFGPLRFRVVADGAAGDWQPLGTLVRLPVVRELTCPTAHRLPCALSGSNLFLIEALSSDRGFEHPVSVPEGFTGSVLGAPRPKAGKLYVKLRDNPSVINVIAATAPR